MASSSILAGVGAAVINIYITVSPCPSQNAVTSVIIPTITYIYQVLRWKQLHI